MYLPRLSLYVVAWIVKFLIVVELCRKALSIKKSIAMLRLNKIFK